MRTYRSSAGFMLLVALTSVGCRDRDVTAGITVVEAQQPAREAPVPLPNRNGSFKFGVLGDFGIGSREQYQLAEQMAALHRRFRYNLVVLVGDNLYGSERPQDFRMKFEVPYKPLLDAGVKFYGSLGNHDAREQRFYKLFNMDGKFYYSFSPTADIRFFALESTYPEPEQIRWLENELNRRTTTGRSRSFTIPCTRQAAGTARTFVSARCSSRCSRSTT